MELDTFRQAGLIIGFDDVSPLEARGLVILLEERNRRQDRDNRFEELKMKAAAMSSGRGR